MKKEYSLKRNEEIAKVVHSRKYLKNDTFILYYLKNPESSHIRICYSVSKKIGIAVVRNKTKRQLRSMASDIFELQENYDFVIVVKEPYLSNDFSTNKEKLNELYLKFKSIIKGV